MTITFSVTYEDRNLILKIADRAVALGGNSRARMNILMDVTATHANGNPLRLQDLLDADDFNFSHDILGIERHLNRETGKLEDGFRPRFSQPAHAVA